MSVIGWDGINDRITDVTDILSENKVIELIQSLRTSQSLIESLEDNTLDEILDSSDLPIKAQIRLQII